MLNTVQKSRGRPAEKPAHARTMGIIERHTRQKEAVRRAILDAARALFVDQGYGNVSIRKIADRIEYSPAAIYGYFASKDDIFFALAEEGFALFAATRPPDDPGRDPLDALRRRFRRYYEFSKSQPEYFALMFVDRAVPRISREWERFKVVHDMRAQDGGAIQRCIDAGIFPEKTDAYAAFHILATAVHGAAVIRLGGRFCPPDAADALAHDTLEAAIAGLRAGIPTTFSTRVSRRQTGGAPRRRRASTTRVASMTRGAGK
jgi:AcrR family transcriptional regulator